VTKSGCESRQVIERFGGASRDRTDGLVVANDALSHELGRSFNHFHALAGEAYDAAVPLCEKIVVVSSAGPGWFADFVTDTL